MTAPEVPTAGYRVSRVYALELSYKTLALEELAEDEREHRSVSLVWDWQPDDEGFISVLFGFHIRGTSESPEEIKVIVVGRFQRAEGGLGVPLPTFVKTNAPAILYPYARQLISMLSGSGPYNAYYMPVANIHSLMEDVDYSATTGAQRLAEDEELAAAYGIEEAESQGAGTETAGDS